MTDQYMQGLAASASFSRMFIAGGIYKLVTMQPLLFLQLLTLCLLHGIPIDSTDRDSVG